MAVEREEFEELKRRQSRLQLLVAAVIASEDGLDVGELLYSYPFSATLDDDREFFYFLQRMAKSTSRRPRRYDLDRRLNFQESLNAEFVLRLGKIEPQAAKSVELEERLEAVEARASELQHDTHHWLIAQSLGLDIAETKLARFVPIRVYLSEDNPEIVSQLNENLGDVLDQIGFRISDEFPPERQSWWETFFAKSKDVLSKEEVQTRLLKLERALEVKALGLPQAEIDDKLSTAAARLITSVDKIPNVAIQSGSILVVKLTTSGVPSIHVRTLTHRELLHLENNQRLLKSPKDILEKLSSHCAAEAANPHTADALPSVYDLETESPAIPGKEPPRLSGPPSAKKGG